MKNSIVVVMLALLPAVYAVDLLTFENCDNLGMECPEDWNLTIEEQKDFVITMLSEKEIQPKHNFVRSWNTNIIAKEPPDGVNSVSDGTIEKAWLVIDVLPSVRANDFLFVNNKGSIHTFYGVDFEELEDYTDNSDYANECGKGSTNSDSFGSGDCRTLYHNEQKIADIYYHLDDVQIGKSTANTGSNHDLMEYDLNKEKATFKTTMQFSHQFDVEHWKWEKESCCVWKKCKKPPCGCADYYYTCKPSQSGSESFDVVLDDEVKVFTKKSDFEFVSLIFEQDKTGYLKVNYNNISYYELDLGEASFKRKFDGYSMAYFALPYNIVTIGTGKENKFIIDNVEILEEKRKEGYYEVKFKVNGEIKGCKIKQSDYFTEEEEFCSYSFMPKTLIKLKPDKYGYEKGEDIKLQVTFESDESPVNGDIKLTYGDDQRIVDVAGNKEVLFTANPDYRSIKAEFDTDGKLSSSTNMVVLSFGKLIGASTVIWALSLLIPLTILWFAFKKLILHA